MDMAHQAQSSRFLGRIRTAVYRYASVGRRTLVQVVLRGLWVCWTSLACTTAAAADGETEGIRWFESRIRPILVERCFECHAGDKSEGGLRLDSLEAMRKGGATGPAIVPGDVAGSLALQAIRYTDSFYQMPPDGRLKPEVVRDWEAWINQGAPAPADFLQPPAGKSATSAGAPSTPRPPAPDSPEAREFWAFRPPIQSALPAVQRPEWCRQPLDYFVLQRLEQAGLEPAPPADRRTWLRRVTYDLTGLPPSQAELDAFVADSKEDAAERVVDRLLASPRYGERWGRHWLDVARYADSNGLDENLAYANAHHYRDYVLTAWNRDLPYDRFVQEQVAGDLLVSAKLSSPQTTEHSMNANQPSGQATSPGSSDESPRQAAQTATGFLALGPKMLACDDGRKMELDIIDEQVDTLGRAFLGLTLGCARCHDHKFDPITSADYYGLAGIFKSTHTMENFNVVAQWHEIELPNSEQRSVMESQRSRLQEIEAKLPPLDQELQKLKQLAPAAADPAVAADASAANAAPTPPRSVADVEKAIEELKREQAQLQAELAAVPRVMGVREGTVTDLPVHIRGNYLTLGEMVPRRFPVVLEFAEQPALPSQQSGRLQLAQWLTHPRHPLTARVMVNRIWLWHFGEGLVRSPDNFGRLGLQPTHPELLDWLAVEFIRQGWSIKWLHRQLMLSASYGMSSSWNAAAAEQDPGNELWWRFPRRRLSAEEVRDSVLWVGGNMEESLGGQLMTVKNREYVTGTGSRDATYDFTRRTVYLPILRSAVYNVLQAFDFGDPSVMQGQRPTTTVTPQALFMMNSPLVLSQAASVVRRAVPEVSQPVTPPSETPQPVTPQSETPSSDSPAAIGRMYGMILGRSPTSAEVERATHFLAEYQQRWRAAVEQGAVTELERATTAEFAAWRGLAHVLIASSEFLYLD